MKMTPMNLGIPQIDNQVPQDSNLIQILAVFLLATCLMLSQTFGSKDLFGKEYNILETIQRTKGRK
jgi:hypothetical protein